jgi:hypothetical protein
VTLADAPAALRYVRDDPGLQLEADSAADRVAAAGAPQQK